MPSEQPPTRVERCPTCGHDREVVTGDEGTSYFKPPSEQPREGEARVAETCDNPDCQRVTILSRRGLCPGCEADRYDPAPSQLEKDKARGDLAERAERFWSKVRCGAPDECWVWVGANNGKGYGQFWSGERNVLAHRWVYELRVGPIPDGYQIDHLCRNRACVNPAHLEAVTPQMNTARGEGLAAQHSRKTHCVHGHEFTPDNTYVAVDGTRRCKTCHYAEVRRRRERKGQTPGGRPRKEES